jgi:hypothetical protein|uniref:Uncharacterized protein n=1 Tax=Desulfobacca acetoxidans TaxID=60893 RepID=A0A7V6A2E2_9BACT
MAKSLSVKEVSLTYAAGALGGLVNGLALWLFGLVGINQLLGVALAPAFAKPFIYNRLVWGAIWGWLFLLPFPRLSYISRGLIYSLAPSLVQIFIVFPLVLHKGVGGMELGHLTPLLVLFYNAIWGVVTAIWLQWSRSSA